MVVNCNLDIGCNNNVNQIRRILCVSVVDVHQNLVRVTVAVGSNLFDRLKNY